MDIPPAASGKVPHARFLHFRYGVYDLTYEDLTPPSLTLRMRALLDWARAICLEMPYVIRQLVDAIRLAPTELVAYTLTTAWTGVYPAIELYWQCLLFDRLGNSFTDGALALEVYWSLCTSWIFCALVNIAVGRTCTRSFEILMKRFRAHFLPKLIHASLRVDLLSIQDKFSVFPVEGRFGSEFPGGLFLRQLSHLVECILALVSQMLVLFHAISRKRSPEREVLLCFCVARAFLRWLVPPNRIGCEGYVYRIHNRHFARMKTLFGLAFSAQYRAHLVLDGIVSSVETEYNKSAEQLGDVEDLDPVPWRTELVRDWYWDFLMEITFGLSIAVYTLLMLPTHQTPSIIASMALLQQATKSISLSIWQFSLEEGPTLLGICSKPKRLYDAIDHRNAMPQGTEPFPRAKNGSSDAGMKISFRHVSLRYPGSDHHALHDVSFEILPGELVLVVGANGSGKSSTLKLLARLFDPTAGEILVDDVPLAQYDIDQLRAAMAFQTQSPVVYPVNVRENIVLGLPPQTSTVKQDHVEEAARMGACSEWISKLSDGYETQLQPSFDINNKWMEGVYGYPSDALMDELARHRNRPVSISDGQKQRLATARMFMRINRHASTRLVVTDEATSSLDPVAERAILTTLLDARAGKTVIVVTHRFHQLAHKADRILCVEDGCVVENGTHADLMRADGAYAALYRAQVEWTGSD